MLKDKPLIRIALYLDEKEHGVRYWPAVPRIGETMMVEIGDDVHRRIVLDVVWGISKESRKPGCIDGQCEVAVICKPD